MEYTIAITTETHMGVPPVGIRENVFQQHELRKITPSRWMFFFFLVQNWRCRNDPEHAAMLIPEDYLGFCQRRGSARPSAWRHRRFSRRFRRHLRPILRRHALRQVEQAVLELEGLGLIRCTQVSGQRRVYTMRDRLWYPPQPPLSGAAEGNLLASTWVITREDFLC